MSLGFATGFVKNAHILNATGIETDFLYICSPTTLERPIDVDENLMDTRQLFRYKARMPSK